MFAQYGQAITVDEWSRRFAERLQGEWPTASMQALHSLAVTLWHLERWNRLAPEVAAVAWIRMR